MAELICRYCGNPIVWKEGWGWLRSDVDGHRFGDIRTWTCAARTEGSHHGHRLAPDAIDGPDESRAFNSISAELTEDTATTMLLATWIEEEQAQLQKMVDRGQISAGGHWGVIARGLWNIAYRRGQVDALRGLARDIGELDAPASLLEARAVALEKRSIS